MASLAQLPTLRLPLLAQIMPMHPLQFLMVAWCKSGMARLATVRVLINGLTLRFACAYCSPSRGSHNSLGLSQVYTLSHALLLHDFLLIALRSYPAQVR